MAGIAGLTSLEQGDWRPVLSGMAAPLTFSENSRTEFWQDPGAALCRVRNRKENADPQPIWSHDGTKCIVLYGECFGYGDQKRQLARNGSVFEYEDDDAEYILRLYERYGDAAFNQLSGSFCFAIYDRRKRELVLVNDRLGSRPVFYGTTGNGTFAFATQVSSVLRVPGVAREVDLAAAVEFCALQRVLGEKTHHRGVKMLRPASVLRYREGKPQITRYWHPDYRPQPGSVDDYAEELAGTMRRALGHITRGEGKVAMLLSGGLDARMAVAAADTDLTCYTFGDYQNPEAQIARQIAEARGFDFKFLKRDPGQYVDMLDTAVEIGNGMHPFNHAHALGFMERIADECDVVTHGFVPELLFRGHSLPKIQRHAFGLEWGSRLDPTLNEANLGERIFYRGYSLLGKGVETVFSREVRAALSDILRASADELIAETEGHAANVYDRFLSPDINYYARYPSMLFELSLRPFMTERSLIFHNDVIDLHLKMPVEVRADDRVWLKALAHLDRNVSRVANANTGYSPYRAKTIASAIEAGAKLTNRLPLVWRLMRRRPPEGARAPVRGASPHSYPRFEWMVRNDPRLRRRLTDTLGDSDALPCELFDLEAIAGTLESHLANRQQKRTILFALLTFGVWNKKHSRRGSGEGNHRVSAADELHS